MEQHKKYFVIMVAIITFCNHGPIVFLKLLIKIGQQWSKHVRGDTF